MKRLVLVGMALFGICFLAMQCTNDDSADDDFHGGEWHREEYVVDSLLITLIDENEQELFFDSTQYVPEKRMRDVLFEIRFLELTFLAQENFHTRGLFEAIAIPAPNYFLLLQDLEITSDKDIISADTTYTAGTDLSPSFEYAFRAMPPSGVWDADSVFLGRIMDGQGYELYGIYAKLPIELHETVDQTFTVTITGPNGEKVSAVSPRVLAK